MPDIEKAQVRALWRDAVGSYHDMEASFWKIILNADSTTEQVMTARTKYLEVRARMFEVQSLMYKHGMMGAKSPRLENI